MEIRIYDDIEKCQSDIVAWSNVKSFNLEKLTIVERELLKTINVIEVVFPGNQGNRENEEVFNSFESFVKKFLEVNSKHSYLFKVENMISERNRIRSYNGIVSRRIEKKDYIEQELNIDDKNTLLTGLIKINEDNQAYLFDDFYNHNCFVLISSLVVFTNEFVQDIVTKYVILDKITLIDYASLILSEVIKDNIVLRAAGDGGDVEVCLQIFVKRKLNTYLLKRIEQAANL